MRSVQPTNDYYETILENISDAVFMLDKDKKITFVNEPFKRLFGHNKREIVGKPIEMICSSAQDRKDLKTAVNDSTVRSKAYRGQLRLSRKDGSNFPAQVTLSGVRNMREKITGYTLIIKEMPDQKGSGTKDRTTELKSLEEMIQALKGLLARAQDEKDIVEERIRSNVKDLVLPYVAKLRRTAPTVEQRTYLDIIETTVKNVFSAFLQKITSKEYHFTPKEIQVATLIRDGMATKDIAEVMKVTRSAIGLHRHHIRNKLGLGKAKINLRSHLLSLE